MQKEHTAFAHEGGPRSAPQVRNSTVCGGEMFFLMSQLEMYQSQGISAESYRVRCQEVDHGLGIEPACLSLREMDGLTQSVVVESLGDLLAGTLFLPGLGNACPALIVAHGAGEFKENYFELCEFLTRRGMVALALDMHGHGESEGERFHVDMREWVADVRAAVEFLSRHPQVDRSRIGAFGLSSGGTAVLEAALVEPRLKALVTLEATVRDCLRGPAAFAMRVLIILGRLKRYLTKSDLRVPLVKLSGQLQLASDPEVSKKLISNPRLLEPYMRFPLPGAAQSFFVNTIQRVSRITIPTMVLWGQDDRLDPPETAELLFNALMCKKQLHIIPGNGHVGHLDRNRDQVFSLTSEWALENLA